MTSTGKSAGRAKKNLMAAKVWAIRDEDAPRAKKKRTQKAKHGLSVLPFSPGGQKDMAEQTVKSCDP